MTLWVVGPQRTPWVVDEYIWINESICKKWENVLNNIVVICSAIYCIVGFRPAGMGDASADLHRDRRSHKSHRSFLDRGEGHRCPSGQTCCRAD